MTAKAKLPPASAVARSKGELPYIMKYLQAMQTYIMNRHSQAIKHWCPHQPAHS